jgi:hypothetical protein
LLLKEVPEPIRGRAHLLGIPINYSQVSWNINPLRTGQTSSASQVDLGYIASSELLIGLKGELFPVKHGNVLVDGRTPDQLSVHCKRLSWHVQQFPKISAVFSGSNAAITRCA